MKRGAVVVLLGVLLTLATSLAYAGGPHVDVKIVSFEAEGNDAFTLVVLEPGRPYIKPITIHLRYSPPAEWPMTKEEYLHVINLLLVRYQTGEVFDVGFVGSGYPRAAGSPEELQVVGFFGGERPGEIHLHFVLGGNSAKNKKE